MRQTLLKRLIFLLALVFVAVSVQALPVNEWRSDSVADTNVDLVVVENETPENLFLGQSSSAPISQSSELENSLISNGEFAVVPEPGTLLLLLTGMLGLSLSGNRQRS
jgi:hypothetical protein